MEASQILQRAQADPQEVPEATSLKQQAARIFKQEPSS